MCRRAITGYRTGVRRAKDDLRTPQKLRRRAGTWAIRLVRGRLHGQSIDRGHPYYGPHSLDPHAASVAVGRVMGTEQLAWPLTEIDRADPTDFVDRWTGYFADAADRNLHRPSTMPERSPAGSWRTS